MLSVSTVRGIWQKMRQWGVATGGSGASALTHEIFSGGK